MATDPIIDQSVKGGADRAKELIVRQRTAAAAFAVPAGYLIAEGDSWFDYPLFQDIVEALEQDFHYKVRSSAHHGDRAEGMAYDDNQLEKTRRVFQELAEDNADGSKTPKAILVSCGGNDVAYTFEMLLNHKKSGLPVINDAIVKGLLEERVKAAISSLIGSVLAYGKEYFGQDLPVIIHGYAFPVPDGRCYPVLNLSGPWLKPGFAAKGYVATDPQAVTELEANAAIMKTLIQRFGAVLDAVAAGIPGVKHVDLTGAFSNVVAGNAYLQDWRDEMHGTKKGFKAAAKLIAAAI